MKVTILGTANAWGPNSFLNPAPLWPVTGTLSDGASVVIRKYRTSLLVETGDRKIILVDCGPDFSHQMRHFRFGTVDAILIAHPHFDHIGGLDDLNLQVYGSATNSSLRHEGLLGYYQDLARPPETSCVCLLR